MDVIVLMKQVPDTATRITLSPDGKDIGREGITYVVNPYDEFAIEEAVKWKEKEGGSVTLITYGPARADEALRTGLAMGADAAARVEGAASDPLVVARAVANAVKDRPFDLILTGKQVVDDDHGQLGPMVAEFLSLPQVTVVTGLELDAAGGQGIAKREVEGGVETVAFSLPAVITTQKGLNEPRYPSLPGIMKAKRKEIEVVAAGDPGAPGLELIGLSLPKPRAEGTIMAGKSAAEAAEELARLLHEDAKLI